MGQVFTKVLGEYRRTKNKKLMMVDSLIVYSLATAAVQVAYMVLVGSFPFNSFLSGFFCHLGIFALAVSLRMQLSMSKEFGQITPEKALGDFLFCCIVFLFIVFSFLG